MRTTVLPEPDISCDVLNLFLSVLTEHFRDSKEFNRTIIREKRTRSVICTYRHVGSDKKLFKPDEWLG